jgi:hypothetical protein
MKDGCCWYRPTYYVSYRWRESYISHFIHIFHSILYIFTILSYFHIKYFTLYIIISLCKRGRPFPSCDVEFLNSCFYKAWWWLYKSKPGRPIILIRQRKVFVTTTISYIIYVPWFPRNFCRNGAPTPRLPMFATYHGQVSYTDYWCLRL